jgi:hypothetical protein
LKPKDSLKSSSRNTEWRRASDGLTVAFLVRLCARFGVNGIRTALLSLPTLRDLSPIVNPVMELESETANLWFGNQPAYIKCEPGRRF